jgi:hypothetical protein
MSKPNHNIMLNVFGQTFHLFAEASVVEALELAMRDDENAESHVSRIAFMSVTDPAAPKAMVFNFRPPARQPKRSVIHATPPRIIRTN